MKKIIVLLALIFSAGALTAQPKLPVQINANSWEAGVKSAGHIQGIAVDSKREFIYVSFTTLLVKLDMQGNVIGSVTGLLGHLGCLEFNEEDGRVYGSLEYKNDAIGKGILKQEGASEPVEDGFYVAIFDVDKINRKGMSAERDGVMTTVLLKTVLDDYKATVPTSLGKNSPHRFCCSGIDGITFGPSFDGKGGHLLTVAYGVYKDIDRTDNNYQVLLQYDTKNWSKYEAPISQGKLHQQGPSKPKGRYFVYTGSTSWGVQNLEYDKERNLWFLAAYKGKKLEFANYTLFVVDGSKVATKAPLQGYEYQRQGKLLSLAEMGNTDPRNPEIRGWHNRLGAMGLCSLGDGLYYIAEGGKTKQGRTARIYLARFTGSATEAFEIVK